jgi:hypothetical protein
MEPWCEHLVLRKTGRRLGRPRQRAASQQLVSTARFNPFIPPYSSAVSGYHGKQKTRTEKSKWLHTTRPHTDSSQVRNRIGRTRVAAVWFTSRFRFGWRTLYRSFAVWSSL